MNSGVQPEELIVVREVAIEIDAANSILIPLFVLVVINSFAIESIFFSSEPMESKLSRNFAGSRETSVIVS